MRLYRPVTVLVGLALVVVGGLIRLALPEELLDEANRYPVRGSLGRAVVGKDFTLTVTRVKLARTVDPNPDDDAADSSKLLETSGIFVTIEYLIEGRHQAASVGNATLSTAEGTRYQAIGTVGRSQLSTPPPGFVEHSSLVFEASPADLSGLTLWVKRLQPITVTTEDYAVDLAVPDQRVADEMVRNAEQTYPVRRTTKRAVQ